MEEKTTQELIDEFLEKGGEIEVIPSISPEERHLIRSTAKKVPELMTLPEAELKFGKKQVKKKKIKIPDFSNINIELIPKHLRGIMKPAPTKEELLETNKNHRCTKANDKS
jgi:hypothetical protein